MVFPVVGANTASAEDLITNSARFDNNANYLYADRFDTPSNADKYTISFWFKIGSRNNVDQLINYNYGNNNRGFVITLRNDASIRWEEFTAGVTNQLDIKTNRLFRDSSAWYHIVVAYDSTQGTASNRAKLYINGVQETSLATATYPDQNFDGFLGTTPNNNKGFIIGAYYNGQGNIDSANYTDGYMAHFYLIDGTAYAASDFGETDTNGVWVPKDAKDNLTFGTNGFFLEFKETGTSANASGIGADTSGNDNHFSVSGFSATDVTTDTPMNNFATFNPLDNYYQQYTYAEGNLKITTNADYYNWNTSTIGVTSGKWYVEGKATQVGTGSDNWVFGIAAHSPTNNNQGIGADNFSIGYRNNGNYKTGDSNSTHGASFSEGDIVMIALDLDNDNVYFGSGGQWADGSGNTDEASPNSAVSLSNLRGSSTLGNTVFFGFGDWNSNASSTVSIGEFNFGNPVHSISSGNADANGYGNFEYAVPSGYYALCTKNLAEYG